jgi:uncharacterized membrane protein YcaP (DUF421 family)
LYAAILKNGPQFRTLVAVGTRAVEQQQVHIFFDTWAKLGRSAVLAVLTYLALVFLLRFSGKRTLSKMNVYDFVFVVALGSVLASTILTQDITLSDGILALVCLMSLQYLLSSLSIKSHRVDSIVNGVPTLVFHNDKFLEKAMKDERVSPEELRAAARNRGIRDMTNIDSIILETDGTFSIVQKSKLDGFSSLEDVPEHRDFKPEQDRDKSADNAAT